MLTRVPNLHLATSSLSTGRVNFYAPLQSTYPKGYKGEIEVSDRRGDLKKFTKGALVMIHQTQAKNDNVVGQWEYNAIKRVIGRVRSL